MNSGVANRRPSIRVKRFPAVVLVGDRDGLAGKPDQRIVLDVGVLVAVPEQLNRGEDQQHAEQQEHEREQVEQGGAEHDEDRPQDQRDDDAEGQHLVLVLLRHGERGHDDHEDEEVVDGQALLDDVTGEVLGAEIATREHREDHTERDGHRDVEDRPGDGLLESDRVRARRSEDQVQGQQADDERNGGDPADGADLEHGVLPWGPWGPQGR